MKKLHETSPIWHAVAWIAVYVLLAGVGDWLSALAGVPNLMTTLVFVALSIGLFLYVKRNGWTGYYGLRRLRGTDFQGTLLYLPLLLIALMQYAKGLRNDLDITTVVLIIALMACVGFLEELLFRGFLFRGILKRGTLVRAVLVSGVTFGIGHAVNLARGLHSR